MVNNKGLTLIELLAVIIIIGIVAMVTTPIVITSISNSKDKATKVSALGYIKAVENSITLKDVNNNLAIDAGSYALSSFDTEFKGTNPSNGFITVDANGEVVSAELCINAQKINYYNSIATIDTLNDCSSIAIPSIPNPDVCFNFNSGTGTITDYYSYAGYTANPGNYALAQSAYIDCTDHVSIPSTIGGVTVRSIGYYAFNRNGITTLYLPITVTNIGDEAFSHNLITNLTIPSSIVSIGEYAFDNNQISSLIFNEGLISIGDEAFAYNQIANLKIPNSVQAIYRSAFQSNLISNLALPTIFATIERGAFNDNQLPANQAFIYGRNGDGTENKTQLVGYGGALRTNPLIPNNVTTIDWEAFYELQITSITIPSNVLVIGSNAFAENEITNLVLNTGLTSIGPSAFYGNQIAGALIIPSTVTNISGWSFQNNNLTSVVIPSSVTSINSDTFRNNQLTSITVPSSVTYIGTGAFTNNQLPNNQAFIYARNGDGSINNTLLVGYGGSNRSNVVIPSTVVTIANYAFKYANITGVTIPNSVTAIGTEAFYSAALTSVIIPNSVTTIGEAAFSWNSLTGVTLSNAITTILNQTFYYNQLTSVTIPNSVTSIGLYAFWGNPLTTIVMGRTGATLNDYAFKTAYTAGGLGTYIDNAGTWTKQ